MTNSRYTFTNPKTQNRITDYFYILLRMQQGEQISNYSCFNMTMGSLKQAGLIKAVNRKGYVLTEKGITYVAYVNSTNKPTKSIIQYILGLK